ncbi:11572_t:CDS:2, partial [Funneliformis caledonium]
KVTVIRSFNKQIQQIKEYETEVEIKNAIRLENQLKTTSPLLQLPIELRLRIVMDYISAKGGRIDNFWTKSLPRLKHRNIAEIYPSERYVEDEPSGSDEKVSPALPNCWNNSLDDHNESNSYDKLDIVIGIHKDDDENPFIIKNGKGSRNNK